MEGQKDTAHCAPGVDPWQWPWHMRPQPDLIAGHAGESSELHPSFSSLSWDELCWGFLDEHVVFLISSISASLLSSHVTYNMTGRSRKMEMLSSQLQCVWCMGGISREAILPSPFLTQFKIVLALQSIDTFDQTVCSASCWRTLPTSGVIGGFLISEPPKREGRKESERYHYFLKVCIWNWFSLLKQKPKF